MTEDKLVMALTATPENPHCGEPLSLAFTVDYTGDVATLHVDELRLQVESGTLPDALCNGFTKDLDMKAPEGWTIRLQKDGTFIIQPALNTPGFIGNEGLEFEINNLIVNDAPGVSTIKMVQYVGANNTRYEQTKNINKTFAPVAIYDLRPVPDAAIEYGASATLSWVASVGSILRLEYNGINITHPKDNTNDPLGVVSSYTIDEQFHQETLFTLYADPSPEAIHSNTDSRDQWVSILPPKVSLDGSVSVKAGHVPEATLTWTTTSANKALMAAFPGGGLGTLDIDAQSFSRKILVDTTYKIKATNSATVDPAYATKALKPAKFDWVQIGEMPLNSNLETGTLMSVHSGIALFGWDAEANWPKHLYISPDGQAWSEAVLPSRINVLFSLCMVHDGLRTYVNGSGGKYKHGIIFQSTEDFVTWTDLPNIPQHDLGHWDMYNEDNVPMCVDDDGALWAYMVWPDNQIWKLPAGASKWIKKGTVKPTRFSNNIQWMDGKLWIAGYDGDVSHYYDPQCLYFSLHSSDGETWTRVDGPTLRRPGPVSMSNAVHDGKICMFQTEDNTLPDPKPTPFALWRLDNKGVWKQDPPISGMSQIPTEIAGVANIGDTLFTYGRNKFSPSSGIWARNT